MPLPDFLPGRFALARGRPSDYFAMEHFHYLPRRPATCADVWVVTYAERDPVAHVARECDAASQSRLAALHFGDYDAPEALWRSAARHDHDQPIASPRVVAVGVLSFPSFRSASRERALNLRDLPHRQRTRFCNAHVRTISRVIVHPQFRGLGLASALVRKLIETCPTRYIEGSAVMAHIHPFFAAAGMRRVACDASEREDAAWSAYFIFDKEEGSSCDAGETK